MLSHMRYQRIHYQLVIQNRKKSHTNYQLQMNLLYQYNNGNTETTNMIVLPGL